MLPLPSQQLDKRIPSAPFNLWKLLEEQAVGLAFSIQQKKTHPLHQFDVAVAQETAALRASGATLLPDKKQAYEDGLKKLAELAHDIHVDGHHQQWDLAATQQVQLLAVLKTTESLCPGNISGQ